LILRVDLQDEGNSKDSSGFGDAVNQGAFNVENEA
jgi:hypothetical protein